MVSDRQVQGEQPVAGDIAPDSGLLVKIWNVKLPNGHSFRAATVEHDLAAMPKRESMCDGCPAPCCSGIYDIVLNGDEFLTRKFPTAFTVAPDWFKKLAPRADAMAVLPIPEGGCRYFDREARRCKKWPDCPMSCRAYDCRDDPRPEMWKFAEDRARETGVT